MKLDTNRALILMTFVISARASSFMFSKLCLVSMTSYSLLALRFSTASVLLLLLFHRRLIPAMNWQNIRSGIVIGTVFYFVLASELAGLKTSTASTSAFIENLAIVIVPFFECILMRRYPEKKSILSAILAVCGVGALTMVGNRIGFSVGECFLFAAAFLYAVGIIVTDRLAKSGDSFAIGFVQVTTTGVLAWVNTGITDSFTMPASASQWVMILVLAVVCTGFGFTLQPVAQAHMSAETASSFCALAPLIASLLSCIFLKDPVTVYSLIGAVLILLSLAIQTNLVKLPANLSGKFSGTILANLSLKAPWNMHADGIQDVQHKSVS